MSATKEKKQKAFWEMKARRYPLPFAPETLAKTNKVLALAQKHGVEFSGTRILDLGCGTGAYTLPLAKRAAWVTGLDLSETMLQRLHKESVRVGIKNVTAVQSSWQEISLATLNWERRFDIVWTAMSPAVRNTENLAKMMRCSRRWCVYIGWGRVRKNALLEEAFRLHGLEFGPSPGSEVISSILATAGKPHSLDYIDNFWEWEGTIDEAAEDIAGHLAIHDATPNRQAIKEMLASHQQKGMIRHSTTVEEGVIVWQV